MDAPEFSPLRDELIRAGVLREGDALTTPHVDPDRVVLKLDAVAHTLARRRLAGEVSSDLEAPRREHGGRER